MRTLVLVSLCLSLLLVPSAPAWAKGKPGVPDKKFQKEIDLAVKRAAVWLRAQQKTSGQLATVTHGSAKLYEIGGTALAGLALLAAGDKQGDPVVDKAMNFCRRKDAEMMGNRTTYDTGVLLMFATKYYGTIPKPKKARKGKTVESGSKRNPCKMPEDVRVWVRAMANFLVEKQKNTGDWGYPAHEADFSNTQYALLGLRAAKDCGIPIPPQVWMNAINRALDTQEQDGPKVKRLLKEKKRTYVIESQDRARGWPYRKGPNATITGSMTTAGIAVLQIAHDGLLNPRKFPQYKASTQLKVAQAVQDGFAWLEVNFAVDRNPGKNAPAWHFYYLYGLERAAVLGGRDLLGEHDWYLVGARYLVDKQLSDGKWQTGFLGTKEFTASDVLDTTWAILFLKRATRPLDPLPMPVVTK